MSGASNTGSRPQLFRKKPVVVEAVQYDGSRESIARVSEFVGRVLHVRRSKILIETLEGTMSADVGDWIIRGVVGEFYPCKPGVFDATYEPAEVERDR